MNRSNKNLALIALILSVATFASSLLLNALTSGLVYFYISELLILVAVLTSIWAFAYLNQAKKQQLSSQLLVRDGNIKSRIRRAIGVIHSSSWIILVCLVLVHIVIKVYIQNNAAGIGVESDLVYYDAKLLLQGLIPYKDFITREPFLLYTTALFLKILSGHLELFLNSYLVFSGLTIVVTYFIGKTISGRSLGLVFAVLYSLSPFLLKFPSANYQYYGSYYLFFLSLTLLALIKFTTTLEIKYTFLSGLLLGICIMYYRGAMPYVMILPVIIIFTLRHYNKYSWKVTAKSIVYSWFGLVIPIILPIAYFTTQMSYSWLVSVLSLKPLIYLTVSYIPLSLTVFLLLVVVYKLLPRISQNIGFLGLVVVLLVLFLYGSADNTLPIDRLGVVNDYIRHIGYVLLPTFPLGLIATIETYFPKLVHKQIVYFICTAAMFLAFLLGVTHAARGTGYLLSLGDIVIFVAVYILFTVICFASFDAFRVAAIKNKYYISLAFLFILTQFAANLLFVEWVDHYVINYVMFSCLIMSIFVLHLIRSKAFSQLTMICLSCLLLVGFTTYFYGKYDFNPSAEVARTDVISVTNYLKENSDLTDTIFTANPTFAFRSGRDLAVPITHPLVYITEQPYFADSNPYGTILSIPELIDNLATAKPKFIIVDQRTKSLFLSERHLSVKIFVNVNYVKVQQIGSIDILQLRSD